MNPATKKAGASSPVVRARNMATNVMTAISGTRSAGSERLIMKTATAAKIATMTATPAISAVITVDAASGREMNSTMYAETAISGMRNVSPIATTASTSTTTRTVFSSRPGVAVTTSCQSRARPDGLPSSMAGAPLIARSRSPPTRRSASAAPEGHGAERGRGSVGRCGPSSGCAARAASPGTSRPHPAPPRPPGCPRRLSPAFRGACIT